VEFLVKCINVNCEKTGYAKNMFRKKRKSTEKDNEVAISTKF